MAEKDTVISMCYVFDRACKTHHWDNAISQIGNKSANDFATLSRQAVCANWRSDHRVSVDREEAMLSRAEFRGSPDGDEWIEQQRKYYVNAICRPVPGPAGQPSSAYVETFNNNNNATSAGRISGNDELIHIASISSIIRRLVSGTNSRPQLMRAQFERIFDVSFPQNSRNTYSHDVLTDQITELCDVMTRRGELVIRQFAGFLIDALGDTQPPWWAGFTQEVKKHVLDKDWVGLCQSFGLSHLEAGERILLWRYPVKQAGALYRPTVVEANSHAFHFPSPPTSRFGLTMPLNPLQWRAIGEVVHRPLELQAAAQYCTGEIGILEESTIMEHHRQLTELRDRHRQELLRVRSDDNDLNWVRRTQQQPWP